MCFSTSAARHLACLQSFLPIFPYYSTLGPPWNSSSCVSPLVGQWLLPAQLQLPTHQDTSLGVFVGTSKQGGGLGRKQDQGSKAFGRGMAGAGSKA